MLRLSGFAATLLLLISVFACGVSAYPFDQNQLPGKGRNYFGCLACHLSDSGGGLTIFGADYMMNNFQFDDTLKEKDSDRDGFANIKELSVNSYQITNPGDPYSFPTARPNILKWLSSLVLISALIYGGFLLINGRLYSNSHGER